MAGKRVLSIGQCAADAWAIGKTLQMHFDAAVVSAATANDALTALRAGRFDLVLINRILDADGSPGLDLLRQIKGDSELHQVPVMVVSNYVDAQRQAVEAGALPGFGKASLGQAAMVERLKDLLEG